MLGRPVRDDVQAAHDCVHPLGVTPQPADPSTMDQAITEGMPPP
jgi:hypothetical protein